MKFKKLLLASAMMGALGGLYGCTEGDDTSILVEGDVTNPTDPGDDGGGGGSSTCPVFASSRPMQGDSNVCQLPASITEDTTLTAGTIWYLDGRVTVGNGNLEMSATQGELANGNPVLDVTLTIEPGTQIMGRTGTFANLLITRGSKIMAEGTAEAPIIMSSDDPGYDGSSEWGGLIIHGYGDHNQCQDAAEACNIDAEGESGFAGGVGTPGDNSGVLSYVVVAEGGYEFAVGNEINGISMVGVGSGTTMDHIQVHGNSDDGVEFYGGDVNVKYLVLTNNLDDSVDWDEGFQGNLQYVIVKQSADSEGNGVEADTEGAADGFLSKPTVANATFIGAGAQTVLHVLKARSGGFFHNSVLTWDGGPAGKSCVEIDGAGAQANRNTSIVYNNVIADCESFGDGVLDQTTVFAVAANLNGLLASGAAEAQLAAPIDWTTVNGTYSESVADPDYLDETDYIGAVDPGATEAWYEGWIIEGSL